MSNTLGKEQKNSAKMPVVSPSRYSTTSSSLSDSYRTTCTSSTVEKPYFRSTSGNYDTLRSYERSEYRSRFSDFDGNRDRKTIVESSRAPSIADSDSGISSRYRSDRSESRSRDISTTRSESSKTSIEPLPRTRRPVLTSADLAMSHAEWYNKYSPANYIPLTQRIQQQQNQKYGEISRSKSIPNDIGRPLAADPLRLARKATNTAAMISERPERKSYNENSVYKRSMLNGVKDTNGYRTTLTSSTVEKPYFRSTSGNYDTLRSYERQSSKTSTEPLPNTRRPVLTSADLAMSHAEWYNKYSPANYIPLSQRIQQQWNQNYGEISRSKSISNEIEKPPTANPTATKISERSERRSYNENSPPVYKRSMLNGVKDTNGYEVPSVSEIRKRFDQKITVTKLSANDSRIAIHDGNSSISTSLTSKLPSDRLASIKRQLDPNNPIGRILEKSSVIHVENGDSDYKKHNTEGNKIKDIKSDIEKQTKAPTNTSNFASYIQISQPDSSGTTSKKQIEINHTITEECPKNDIKGELRKARANLKYIDSEDEIILLDNNTGSASGTGFENKTFEHENYLKKRTEKSDDGTNHLEDVKSMETSTESTISEPIEDFSPETPSARRRVLDTKNLEDIRRVAEKARAASCRMMPAPSPHQDLTNDDPHRFPDSSSTVSSQFEVESPAAHKSPITVLYENYPGLAFICTFGDGSSLTETQAPLQLSHSMRFKVVFQIKDKKFEGYGSTKKLAKLAAAWSALAALEEGRADNTLPATTHAALKKGRADSTPPATTHAALKKGRADSTPPATTHAALKKGRADSTPPATTHAALKKGRADSTPPATTHAALKKGRADSTPPATTHAALKKGRADSTPPATTHAALKKGRADSTLPATTHAALKEGRADSMPPATTHAALKKGRAGRADSTPPDTKHATLKEGRADSTPPATTHAALKEGRADSTPPDTKHATLKEGCADSTPPATTHAALKEGRADSTPPATTHAALKDGRADSTPPATTHVALKEGRADSTPPDTKHATLKEGRADSMPPATTHAGLKEGRADCTPPATTHAALMEGRVDSTPPATTHAAMMEGRADSTPPATTHAAMMERRADSTPPATTHAALKEGRVDSKPPDTKHETLKEVRADSSPLATTHAALKEGRADSTPPATTHAALKKRSADSTPPATTHVALKEGRADSTPPDTKHATLKKGRADSTPPATTHAAMMERRADSTPPATTHAALKEGRVDSTPPATTHVALKERSADSTPPATTHVALKEGRADSTPPDTKHATLKEGRADSMPPATTHVGLKEGRADNTPPATTHAALKERSADSTPPATTHMALKEGRADSTPPDTKHATLKKGRADSTPPATTHAAMMERRADSTPPATTHAALKEGRVDSKPPDTKHETLKEVRADSSPPATTHAALKEGRADSTPPATTHAALKDGRADSTPPATTHVALKEGRADSTPPDTKHATLKEGRADSMPPATTHAGLKEGRADCTPPATTHAALMEGRVDSTPPATTHAAMMEGRADSTPPATTHAAMMERRADSTPPATTHAALKEGRVDSKPPDTKHETLKEVRADSSPPATTHAALKEGRADSTPPATTHAALKDGRADSTPPATTHVALKEGRADSTPPDTKHATLKEGRADSMPPATTHAGLKEGRADCTPPATTHAALMEGRVDSTPPATTHAAMMEGRADSTPPATTHAAMMERRADSTPPATTHAALKEGRVDSKPPDTKHETLKEVRADSSPPATTHAALKEGRADSTPPATTHAALKDGRADSTPPATTHVALKEGRADSTPPDTKHATLKEGRADSMPPATTHAGLKEGRADCTPPATTHAALMEGRVDSTPPATTHAAMMEGRADSTPPATTHAAMMERRADSTPPATTHAALKEGRVDSKPPDTKHETLKEVRADSSPPATTHAALKEGRADSTPPATNHVALKEGRADNTPPATTYAALKERSADSTPPATTHVALKEGRADSTPPDTKHATLKKGRADSTPPATTHAAMMERRADSTPPATTHAALKEGRVDSKPPDTKHETLKEVRADSSPPATTHAALKEGRADSTPPATTHVALKEGRADNTPPATTHAALKERSAGSTPPATTHVGLKEGRADCTPPATTHAALKEGRVDSTPPATTHAAMMEGRADSTPPATTHAALKEGRADSMPPDTKHATLKEGRADSTPPATTHAALKDLPLPLLKLPTPPALPLPTPPALPLPLPALPAPLERPVVPGVTNRKKDSSSPLSSLFEAASHKNPITVLYENYPGLAFSCTFGDGSSLTEAQAPLQLSHSMRFKVVFQINDKKFEGYGSTKKLAKLAAAWSALAVLEEGRAGRADNPQPATSPAVLLQTKQLADHIDENKLSECQCLETAVKAAPPPEPAPMECAPPALRLPLPTLPALPKRPEVASVTNGKEDSSSLVSSLFGAASPAVYKCPVTELYENYPGLAFSCTFGDGSPLTEMQAPLQLSHSMRFKMVCQIKDKKFEGYGSNKKRAKLAAACSALAALEEGRADSTPPATSHKAPRQSLADHIGKLVNEKFNELMKNDLEHSKRMVLAGIVITTHNRIEDARVIAVTTGTKCVSGEHMSVSGRAVNDCHAEVVARRCLQRHLYAQLLQYANQPDPSQPLEENDLEPLPGGGYQLKASRAVHLYISTAPCGDGRIFSPHEHHHKTDKHPNRLARGQLRTKIESGEGTIPVKNSDNVMQTWDGIMQGERLLTMSCSDKVARWCVCGLQGALLSRLIRPVYLTSLVLGSLLHPQHMYRAICGRIETHISSLPPPFHLQRPQLSRAASMEVRSPARAPSSSVCWCSTQQLPEVIKASTGKLESGQPSLLCKQSMFARWHYLVRHLPLLPQYTEDGAPLPEMPDNTDALLYNEAKQMCPTYQLAKQRLIEAFEKANLGRWIKRPLEQDQFVCEITDASPSLLFA